MWLQQIRTAFEFASDALQDRNVTASDVLACISELCQELTIGEAQAVVEAAKTEAASAINGRNRAAFETARSTR